jgi:hypothetical protein
LSIEKGENTPEFESNNPTPHKKSEEENIEINDSEI